LWTKGRGLAPLEQKGTKTTGLTKRRLQKPNRGLTESDANPKVTEGEEQGFPIKKKKKRSFAGPDRCLRRKERKGSSASHALTNNWWKKAGEKDQSMEPGMFAGRKSPRVLSERRCAYPIESAERACLEGGGIKEKPTPEPEGGN